MRFPPSLLDEIRARLPVSQVIGRRVKLRRQGREYAGLSPFKQEKTPSFTVNDQKGFYHCFASGEHGDIFTFLMKVEGLDFTEAVERLANEAGVELPKSTPQAEAREVLGIRLRKLMGASCSFFAKCLQSSAGRDARDYLERRGLSAKDIETFRLGYAPNGRSALKEHLAAQGFSQEDMAAAGMLISGDDIPVSYDRFRHRLIFPITDLRGEIIAFGGRALDADQQPKYLNSPETPLFHKSSVLYNAAAARKSAHDSGAIIVAEGYMDVIALTRAGFLNAVAPLGTAITPEQLKLLWRMANEPILCLDGDSAGRKAAYRAIETALPHLTPGKSLAFAFLPEGLDPDDLLRQQGEGAVNAVLENTRPLVDVLWSKELETGLWDTPERRAQFQKRLDELIDSIADKTVRHYYGQDLHKRLRDQFYARREQGAGTRPSGAGASGSWQQRMADRPRPGGSNGGKRNKGAAFADHAATSSLAESALVRSAETAFPPLEVLILKTLINHPWLLDEWIEEIANIQFEANTLQQLLDLILGLYGEQIPLDNQALHHHFKRLGHDRLVTQLEHAITHNSDWNTQPHASQDDVLIGWRHRLALHRKSVELKRERDSAARAFETDQSEENYLRLQDLLGQLWNMEGLEVASDGYGKNNNA